MASFTSYDFLGGWQDDLAKIIVVDTGVKGIGKDAVERMNKRYEEAIGYNLTGSYIDDYVSKNASSLLSKISVSVAKSFRLNIEKIKADEDMRLKKIAEDRAKRKMPNWYYGIIAAGVIVTLVALSPSLNRVTGALLPKR